MNNECAGANDRAHPDLAVLHDRRRPGRRNDVDPSLIPLLRGQVRLEDVAAPVTVPLPMPVRDDLAPVVGILRGMGLVCIAGVGLALLVLF